MPKTPQSLAGSWKRRYPFRTGTTSFIYPAGYTDNVARLGPHLDEIELLLFESGPASRPTPQLVEDLLKLSREHAISFNVHLPTDLDLTHPDPSVRIPACIVVRDFIHQLAPLDPTVYVLHLTPPNDAGHHRVTLATWQMMASDSLARILATGVTGNCLALENLFFPFEWLAPLINEYDLGVCLDIGHLALQNGDLDAFLKHYGDRIVIGHLHGIENGRDHQSLAGGQSH